jgi:hypothetical protein
MGFTIKAVRFAAMCDGLATAVLLPQRADMTQRGRKVRSVPIAAISSPKAQEVVTFGGLGPVIVCARWERS